MKPHIVHRGFWATWILVIAAAPSIAAAVDVPKWSTCDISLAAGASYSNGYASGPTLSATFTGPGGITEVVPGYWDGANSFKIRFTPTVVGDWSYTTTSSDSSLNNQVGNITATAAQSGDHGFLRIDPANTSTFIWDDGTHDFTWGQTYYDIVSHGLVNDSWKTTVDTSAAHGMNKIILNVYTDFYDGDAAHHGYPDIGPYAGSASNPDRDSINIQYWQKLDEVVQYLDSKGMVANLVLTNPYSNNRVYGTDTQNDRLIAYAVSRYAAYTNVTWNLCYEWEQANKGTYPQDQADFNRFGGIVRTTDPWMTSDSGLRPLSIHNQSSSFQYFGATWPTYAILQHHSDTSDPAGSLNTGIRNNLGHGMPVVNDEYRYIGQRTQTQLRQGIWGIATAGGYGSSGDWRMISDGSTSYRPAESVDWADAPEYDDIKYLVDFFTTKGIEYWKMAGHNELKTSGTNTYVLAEPGRQYVIYDANGGNFSVNLAAGTYHAYLYDPQTGTTTDLGTRSGGVQSFSTTSGHDWVVHLSTFQEAPEPATLILLGIGSVAAFGYRLRQRGSD